MHSSRTRRIHRSWLALIPSQTTDLLKRPMCTGWHVADMVPGGATDVPLI